MRHPDIEAIKRSINALSKHKCRRRYPPRLCARLVALVRARPETSVGALARSVGMPPATLARIVSGGRPVQNKIVPVQVMADRASRTSVVVHGPNGVRVEGLDVDGVAHLFKALS